MRIARDVCRALRNCTAEKSAAIVKSLKKKASFAYLDRQVAPDQVAHHRPPLLAQQ